MKLFAIVLSFISFHSFCFAGEILYKLKDNKTKSFKGHDLYFDEVVSSLNVSDEKIFSLFEQMKASNYFEFVELNTKETQDPIEQWDAFSNYQYHHQNIQTKAAWNYTQGSEDTIVAVCDSGIEKQHEDLKGIILESDGWDFQRRDDDPEPVTSHGTFVAGIIASHAHNNLGGFGIAPKIKILPLKIATSKGGTSMRKITDCIRYAANKGAKVINVSFTGVNSRSVSSAGKYAQSKGALLVYSAGNQGWDLPRWRDKKYVMAIGAVNNLDQRWTYINEEGNLRGSNIGPFVDLVAPGANIYSTTTYIRHNTGGAKYRFGSGTSYSAPMVSGVAALIYSLIPNITPQEVESILENSTDQIGDSYHFGAGRLNARKAVEQAIRLQSFVGR